MKRVQGDESPWRRFGGAQPPTDSPRKTRQGQYDHAKRAHAAPPTPFLASLRSPSGSPQRNAQARSELTKPDNCTAFENVLTAIPTHGGTGTQHSASCFSFPDEGKETGVIERKTFQQERMAARTDHTTPQQEHRTGIAAHKPPPDPPRPADQPPRAHNPLCRSCNRPNAAFRRRTIHYPMKRNSASPRQRGRRIDNIPLRLTTPRAATRP